MPDVRMPDGTIIRNVPANTPRDELVRRYERARQSGAVADNRPTSFLQGVANNVSKAAGNLSWLQDALTGRTIAHAITGQPAPSDIIRAQAANRAQHAKSQGSTFGNVAGGVLGTLPAMLVPGGVLAQGAASGAMLTDNPNNLGGVVRDMATGAIGGKLGQLGGKHIAAPIMERVGRTAPARAAAQYVARTANRILPPQLGGGVVRPLPLPKFTPADKAVVRMSPDVAAARQIASDAAKLHLPVALADVDPRLQQLAGSVARHSPDARAIAEQAFNPRAEDRGVRAIQGISQYLDQPVDVKQVGREIIKTARTESNPHYEKAFEGGSMAPLETQLTEAHGLSSKAVADAQAELAAANRQLTLSRAATSRAGNNVYVNAHALPADRQATAAVSAAEQKLANAQAQHGQVLDILRQSQGDAAANAPGAIWSPRVQQFLDDPISKQGLSRGLEIQRLEALAQGKPFNPTEYGITGMDESGKPIVSNVPNMRTLDAVKKGLDAFIDDYPKDFKGNPILDERGGAIVQVNKALRGELDRLNPAYGDARGVYQQYAREKDALDQGFNSAGRTVPNRDVENIIAGYAPNEDGFNPQLSRFRSGYATNLRDQVAGAADSADPYKLINGGIERRAKIQTTFPEGAPTFSRQHEIEDIMSQTRNKAIGGSQTRANQASDDLFQNDAVNMAVDGALQAATGGGIPGATKMVGIAGRKVFGSRDLGILGAEKKANAIAPMLFDTNNPKAITDYLDELNRKLTEQETRRVAYQRTGGLFGRSLGVAPALAVGGLLSQ